MLNLICTIYYSHPMLNIVLFLLSQLHFVSYNTKYADILDALNHEDGLAVLGLFIQVTQIKSH